MCESRHDICVVLCRVVSRQEESGDSGRDQRLHKDKTKPDIYPGWPEPADDSREREKRNAGNADHINSVNPKYTHTHKDVLL